MIVDRIGNAKLYYGLADRVRVGLEYLESVDASTLEAGRHDILGDDCYAIVTGYNTQPQGEWEAHRKYIDIQYIVSGAERVGYVHIDSLSVKQEYDEQTDCMLLSGEGDFVSLRPKMLAIFFPEDAHMPGLSISDQQTVKKIIVKVKIS